MSVYQPTESAESQQPSAPLSAVPATTAESLPMERTTICEPEVSAKKSENVVTGSQQTDKSSASWLWLTKQDQAFVSICVAIFLALTGYHWARLGGWGMQPIDVDRLPARQYDFRIDINSASWVEWTQIEGIGQATANKIISDREANGPFNSINDLLRVKGIGPKTLEKMRPFLREPKSDDD